jgi:hypothetical protein
MGKSTINGYKWPFSIAMLVYQRVGCRSGPKDKWALTNFLSPLVLPADIFDLR